MIVQLENPCWKKCGVETLVKLNMKLNRGPQWDSTVVINLPEAN